MRLPTMVKEFEMKLGTKERDYSCSMRITCGEMNKEVR